MMDSYRLPRLSHKPSGRPITWGPFSLNHISTFRVHSHTVSLGQNGGTGAPLGSRDSPKFTLTLTQASGTGVASRQGRTERKRRGPESMRVGHRGPEPASAGDLTPGARPVSILPRRVRDSGCAERRYRA